MAGEKSRPVTATQRRGALLLAYFFLAVATIVFPAAPATAAAPVPAAAAAELCSLDQWKNDFKSCVDKLADVTAQRAQCLEAPTPDSPDSGLGGWFATQPDSAKHSGVAGPYSRYGYAGYAYTTYDIGCLTIMHPDYKFENTVANGEFMLATSVIGASNALRERAWNPSVMWGWADPLVQKVTKNVYARVFTVFGAVTLAIVGIYLLWRSRQANMSMAMTTAGWAILVMVVVTALAAWPTFSAHMADRTLVSSLGVVHDAVGPPSETTPPAQCHLPDPDACIDHRVPAVRASDTVVQTMLYRNWLRGLLGSADSLTAQKYGPALYDARSLTWGEEAEIAAHPEQRDVILKHKSDQWMKVAEQIRTEDPEAYQYLTGAKGMERIGAGFIALLSAIMFALFDLVASILVLLGFLIFRWSVVAAPLIGTVALLRPASAGFRRLANIVVAAIFNIIIFGTGSAIYLYAVDLLMSTTSLPGWLQVILVFLSGLVGWILLRPYRRITEMGGQSADGRGLRRLFFRDSRQAAAVAAAAAAGEEVGERSARRSDGRGPRTEGRAETVGRPEVRTDVPPGDVGGVTGGGEPLPTPDSPRRRMPVPAGGGWSEPAPADAPAAFTVYRPTRSRTTISEPAAVPDELVRVRAEGRRDG